MVRRAGIEAPRCLTRGRIFMAGSTISLKVRQLSDLPAELTIFIETYVRRAGIEPATISLKGCCSTE